MLFLANFANSLDASRNKFIGDSTSHPPDLNISSVENGGVSQPETPGSILWFPGVPKEKRREIPRFNLGVGRRQGICQTGSTECGNGCCPAGSTVCCSPPSGSGCCKEGTFCTGVSSCCVLGSVACGNECCEFGVACCNGKCCSPTSTEVVSTPDLIEGAASSPLSKWSEYMISGGAGLCAILIFVLVSWQIMRNRATNPTASVQAKDEEWDGDEEPEYELVRFERNEQEAMVST